MNEQASQLRPMREFPSKTNWVDAHGQCKMNIAILAKHTFECLQQFLKENIFFLICFFRVKWAWQ